MGTHEQHGKVPGSVEPDSNQSQGDDRLAHVGANSGDAPDVSPEMNNARGVRASGEVGSSETEHTDSEAQRASEQEGGIGDQIADDSTTSEEKRIALELIRDAIPGNTGHSQERRLLAALPHWNVDTFEASRYLDVYYPPARIMSLRRKGHNILMVWKRVPTECGRLHRVGNYVLVKEARDAQ